MLAKEPQPQQQKVSKAVKIQNSSCKTYLEYVLSFSFFFYSPGLTEK